MSAHTENPFTGHLSTKAVVEASLARKGKEVPKFVGFSGATSDGTLPTEAEVADVYRNVLKHAEQGRYWEVTSSDFPERYPWRTRLLHGFGAEVLHNFWRLKFKPLVFAEQLQETLKVRRERQRHERERQVRLANYDKDRLNRWAEEARKEYPDD